MLKTKFQKALESYIRLDLFSKTSLVSLYYSNVYPYLTYCIEAWGCAM